MLNKLTLGIMGKNSKFKILDENNPKYLRI